MRPAELDGQGQVRPGRGGAHGPDRGVCGPRTTIRDISCCCPPANGCPMFASRTTQAVGHPDQPWLQEIDGDDDDDPPPRAAPPPAPPANPHTAATAAAGGWPTAEQQAASQEQHAAYAVQQQQYAAYAAQQQQAAYAQASYGYGGAGQSPYAAQYAAAQYATFPAAAYPGYTQPPAAPPAGPAAAAPVPAPAEALPAGWTSAVDPASGKTYYIDKATKESRWEKPTEPAGKTARKGGLSCSKNTAFLL